MRRLLLVLVLLGALPAWAGAATIIGKPRAETIKGTPRADLIDVVGGGRDSVSCGKGIDTVAADPADRVAADCEVVARRIAGDTSNGPGAHTTIVEPGVAAAGSTIVSVFQEGRQKEGADGIGYATSRDGGATWRSGLLPSLALSSSPAGPWAQTSDPVVAYDALHARWIAAGLAISSDAEEIFASTSPDGLAWSAPRPVVAGPRESETDVPLDKDWITCDDVATSPLRGHCYVVATAAPDTALARLTVWSSADGGATWVQGGSLAGGYYAQAAVRADGALVLFYLDFFKHLYSAVTSTDGGATFGQPVVVTPPLPNLGSQDLRAPSLPSMTLSATGELLTVWASCTDTFCQSSGVELTRSTDGGATWTPPATLPLGPGLHVVPSIASDPASGRLALSGYVTNSTTCCALVAQIATSRDGGATWTTRRASVRPFQASWLAPALGGAFLGDYIGTAFANGRAVAVLPFAEPPLNGQRREDLFAVRF